MIEVPDWAGYLRFREAFEGVMDPALYTIEWLDAQVLSGVVKVWIGRNAAIIAELKRYPTGALDVSGLVAAGDADEIVAELIPQAEAWGRSIGCVGALIESRPGWARVLKPYGYAPHQQTIRKVF